MLHVARRARRRTWDEPLAAPTSRKNEKITARADVHRSGEEPAHHAAKLGARPPGDRDEHDRAAVLELRRASSDRRKAVDDLHGARHHRAGPAAGGAEEA